MWMFVIGALVGCITTVGSLVGLFVFIDTYHVSDYREVPRALKDAFFELYNLIRWNLKLIEELEPEGTVPEVGDVIFLGRRKLDVIKVHPYEIEASGDPRELSRTVILPSRQFLGKSYDSKQWRIKKRPPYEDPAIYWWKNKTVQELRINDLSPPKKKELGDTYFAGSWNGTALTTYADTYSGTL